jgi:hypothetical protein
LFTYSVLLQHRSGEEVAFYSHMQSCFSLNWIKINWLSKYLTVGLLISFFFCLSQAQGAALCRSLFSMTSMGNHEQRFVPAVQLAKGGSEFSRYYWKSLDERFREHTVNEMNLNAEVYREAKARRDPHILFLESLGFVFPSENVRAIVPPLLEIIEKIQLRVQKNIDQGLIRSKDALFPKMVVTAVEAEQFWSFGRSDGMSFNVLKGHLMEPGGDLPITTYFSENSRDYKDSNFLTSKEFHQLIAKGHFPIGGLQSANVGARHYVNEIMHDLAHWDAMITDPQFMASIKKTSLALLKSSYTGPDISEKSFLLEFIAYEAMVINRPDKLDQIPKYLGLEELLSNKKNPSLGEIEKYYLSLDKALLDSKIKTMRDQFFHFFVGIGGAHRDLVSFGNMPDLQFPHIGLLGSTQTPKSAATFAYYILRTKDLSASQWLELLTSEKQLNHDVIKIIFQNYEERRRR